MVTLKNAEFRHNDEGQRVAEIILYTDSLDNLPTEASDIEGLLDDDVIDDGSIALDMTNGKVAMFTGEEWCAWS